MTQYIVLMLCAGLYLGLVRSASAHSAIINHDAWQVCENRSKSDACEYTDNHADSYRGTCQLMSEKLLCVRNQPIERAGSDAAHRSTPVE